MKIRGTHVRRIYLLKMSRHTFCENKNSKLTEFNSKNDNSPQNGSKLEGGKVSFLKKVIPVQIVKKDNSYYISVKAIADRSKILGVILSKKMREQHPKTWNNVIAFGVLIGCAFLFWWRLLDFKTTLVLNQAYAVKPLITMKVSEENKLTDEDLNFIYERPVEYELDKEMQEYVEKYRSSRKLPINKKYREEIKFNLVENPNRKRLF